MKKSFSVLAVAGLLGTNMANAKVTATISYAALMLQDGDAEAKTPFTQVLKEQFIQGGPVFMGIVLLCLILGLAVAIERIIYLNMASTNSAKLKQQVEDALASGGVEAAKEVCRNTK
ncbi:MAG: MotA/TolQ/ExbB proton channel family protein, partial [Flavobacteriaceae bacterium]